jgi:glycogen phosphorylase
MPNKLNESKPAKSKSDKARICSDEAALRHDLVDRVTYVVGKNPEVATGRDWLNATAYMVRDHMVDSWIKTSRNYYKSDVKRVYYFSLEFLMGRSLMNSVLNLHLEDASKKALHKIGVELEDIQCLEYDAGLGNGGLGRLAACFLDSMATLNLPGFGYGIRYEYGMFMQSIDGGRQVEHPDNWLRYGNPWEFARPEVLYPVNFNGRVVEYDKNGVKCHCWEECDEVMAMAFDTPIPGYGTSTVNKIRLWSAKSSRDFDLGHFNAGNYVRAVEDKNATENISKVLYPNDTTSMGKELRLKQQYFFVCASLQDVIRRHAAQNESIELLPEKVAIQLNDTHPSIAIAELMRVLVDLKHMEWKNAWDITVRTFSYTNHTLMPEALETWPVGLFELVLPRHMQIIYEINQQFLNEVRHQFPGDMDIIRRMSIIDEGNGGGKYIRMSHLAIVGSHKVNGVAQIHSDLMKQTIFADFHRFYPGKFVNMTNGITPRRWLNQANPILTKLISKHIDCEWVKDLSQLKKLEKWAKDEKFCAEFSLAKHKNKIRLAEFLHKNYQIKLNVDSLFDVQIKRIHEYKRQLLNVLHVVTLYNRIRHNPDVDYVPRTVIFGGKSAPGYMMAKLIIKLINDVADIVNHDPLVRGRLKVVFVPNYNVSSAEIIIPAADLSEQISTAGTEASGTGNMKLALNGALTIGTLDGANVEIRDEVGDENIFIFGLTTDEVASLRATGYKPWEYYQNNDALREVLDMIGNGFFSQDEPARFKPIVDSLLAHGDHYLLLADYASYIACQQRVEEAYRDQKSWVKKAILNVANMGKFSSDRTIMQYAEKIWDAKPCVVPE